MKYTKNRKTNTHNKNYGAIKTTVGGILFDSKLEALEYVSLKKLEDAGAISDLVCHPPFEILPSFKVKTNTVKSGTSKKSAMKYTPDFIYKHGIATVVIEVKGFADTAYKMRKNMFLFNMARYGVDEFIEVTAKERKSYKLIKEK